MLKRNKLHFEGHFTQIPNSWVRDSRLSYKARGILAWLMSHEVGWRTSAKQLEADLDKRDAIQSALKELETLGYLVRQQSHNADTGKFAEAIWILNDPFADLPLTDLPYTDNPHTKNTNLENTNIKNLAHSENERLFDEFWKIYPRKVGKGKARNIFIRRPNKDEIIEGARRLAADPNLPETQFIPHPTTWLNREGWLDDPYPPKETKTEEPKTSERPVKWGK